MSFFILPLEVAQQGTPLTHQEQEAPARMVIARVDLHVFGRSADALGEERNLHLGRARIQFLSLELAYDLSLFGCG